MHKRINKFVWPALLANLSTPILSLGDTAIIGNFASTTDLSAVAAGAAVISMAVGLFGFLRMGTTGEVARAFGRQSTDTINQVIVHSLSLAVALGVFITLLLQFFQPWLTQLINPNNASTTLSGNYITIRSLGVPAALWLMVINGWLLGLQRPIESLWLATGINVSNLVLSYLAVAVFDMGAQGAAAATVIAEYCGVAYSVVWLSKRANLALTRFDRSLVKRLLKQNSDLLLRSLLLMVSMSFFTAQSARLGDDYLALNAIILNILLAVSYALDGLANAVEALTGEAVGEKNQAKLYQVWRAGCLWALVFALVFAMVFWIFKNALIDLFTNDSAIIALSANYTVWLSLLPLVAVWAYYLDGIFIGTGKLSAMRNTMIVSGISYMGLWLMLQNLGVGNHGLWFCFFLLHVLRAGGLAAYMGYYHRHQQWL